MKERTFPGVNTLGRLQTGIDLRVGRQKGDAVGDDATQDRAPAERLPDTTHVYAER